MSGEDGSGEGEGKGAVGRRLGGDRMEMVEQDSFELQSTAVAPRDGARAEVAAATSDPRADPESQVKVHEPRDPVAASHLVFGRYPRACLYIIGQEFSERATYYGLRTILVLYLVNYFGYTNDRATVWYHVFVMVSYLTSILGGILADSSWGKYKTIFWLSIVYLIGSSLLSFTSVNHLTGSPPSPWGAFLCPSLSRASSRFHPFLHPMSLAFCCLFHSPLLVCLPYPDAHVCVCVCMWTTLTIPTSALAFIALGTGGIKPCVSAFGGDQFTASQSGLIQAFGVPAALMAVALVVFVAGRHLYRYTFPTRNVLVDCSKAIWMGLRTKLRGTPNGIQYSHWLEPAEKRFGQAFIREVRVVLGVFVLFTPAPIFWALFDQQGSRWTLQAEQMKTFSMGALGEFRPDMMQALGPLLVMLMIPLFERGVYPLLALLRIRLTPLQRMGYGMILCALSFVISGLVQGAIDRDLRAGIPTHNQAYLRVLNAQSEQIWATYSDADLTFNTSLLPGNASAYYDFDVSDTNRNVTFELHRSSPPSTLSTTWMLQAKAKQSLVVYRTVGGGLDTFATDDYVPRDADTVNPDEARVRIINACPDCYLIYYSPDETNNVVAARSASSYDGGVFTAGRLEFIMMAMPSVPNSTLSSTPAPTTTTTLASTTVDPNASTVSPVDTITVAFVAQGGGDYSLLYTPQTASSLQGTVSVTEDKSGNGVSILWQAPQYIVITAGEILFSVTGLEMAFSEAPASMKAVVQAGWLLTTTLGSLIVIIVAESSFFRQRDEFFFFAGCMGAVTILFAWLARDYRYNNSRYLAIAHDLQTDDTGQEKPLLTDSRRASPLTSQPESDSERALDGLDDTSFA
ncbi:uncharacterized protein MONBRDRAFT_27711 [Monosiga brevicollis MX1]|uniref:Uncharacterized protein n=1 Tax=Monosiga brevicollis TaxID=81824 RepID=A9V631_MONBE|nr:uncharacterized protein MONBRDRAFT_27711 [Monosiga brevicollis MX1]EDQ86916.1 predicted protein [Monosiga brevicollis MX1]|eukprot:XP_001748155.1 hypothetical protein [Monosiga brevicollis MX1]